MTRDGVSPASSRRPSLHFTAQRGWINDPHGVTFRDGRYHLFHQAVPDAVEWNLAISWGHATSADLLTWEHQPPVLVPGDGDDGCWSGSVCVAPPDAPAAMYYTSVERRIPTTGTSGSPRRPTTTGRPGARAR